MKKITKILISGLAGLSALIGFANVAFAAPISSKPILVDFVEPLFNVDGFAPGDTREAKITIGNNTGKSQGAYIEAVSVYNDDNLASQMRLEFFEGESNTAYPIFNFDEFLVAGPVQLSTIPNGVTKIYRLKVTFLEGAGNDYQGKTLGFDICIGFAGGNETCTKEIVINEEEGNININGSSGSGSGSSGGHHLIITKEEKPITYLNNNQVSGTAVLSWDTNIPSTSQVIYRLASDNSYSLDLGNLPGLGYPFYSNEIMTKDTHHSVLITGLNPGATYVYRVVSRASPPTISYEHEFIVPTSGSVNVITGLSSEEGSVLGINSSSTIDEDKEIIGEIAGAFNEKDLASVISSGWDKLSWWWLLVLFIMIFLIWRFIIRKK
jgi:hypothetical protein